MSEEMIQFRPGKLRETLAARAVETSPDLVAKQDLESLYQYMIFARKKIRDTFTEAEISMLCDIFNGSIMQREIAHLLIFEVMDALSADAYDLKWGVDRRTLLKKMENLSYFERYVLHDGIRQFWHGPYHQDSMRKKLEAIGLIQPQEEQEDERE